MIIVVICLSIALVISAITITNLLDKNNGLRTELDSAKREVESSKIVEEEMFDIMPGDTVIIKNYGLVNTNPNRDPVKIEYKVTYEVTILEVSKDSVKVTANDFTSFDRYARDPNSRPGIMNFMKDKWIDKNMVEIVVDQRKIRDRKLSELGIV